MPRFRALLPCCCLVLAASAVVPADQPQTVVSAWRTVDFAPTGDAGEWPTSPATLTASPVQVDVMNDGGALYLRVRSTDRGAQLQLLFGGLTVWFDPKGGDKKVFGVRYPVGSPLPDPRARARERNRQRPDDPATFGGRQAPGHARGEPTDDAPKPPQGGPPLPTDLSDVVPRRLEVLGPGKDDARSLVLDHAAGIAVRIERVGEAVVYELKVPLAKSAATPYAIGAAPGTTIGLAFESPKMEREKPPDNSTSGSGTPGAPRGPGGINIGGIGGGMGGPGGMGRPPDGPGERGGGLPETAKPWKAWMRVVLAKGPASAGQ